MQSSKSIYPSLKQTLNVKEEKLGRRENTRKHLICKYFTYKLPILL